MDVLWLFPYDCLLNFILDCCLPSSVRDMPVAGGTNGSMGLEEELLCGRTLQSGGRDGEEAIRECTEGWEDFHSHSSHSCMGHNLCSSSACASCVHEKDTGVDLPVRGFPQTKHAEGRACKWAVSWEPFFPWVGNSMNSGCFSESGDQKGGRWRTREQNPETQRCSK